MSHELRTQVNAVLGWSEILESGAGGDAMRERALAAIKRSARAQAQIIADLLDVSRIVTGKLHLEHEWVDLAGVVESALETVKLAADAKQIQLSTALGESPVIVLGDADRLRQVFINLIDNAVKHSPRGGSVVVNGSRVDGQLVVTVRDEGSGLPQGADKRLFRRFYRGDNASQRDGAGLGLAIAQAIAEAHGGSISARNIAAGGAEFTVRLPAT